MKTAFLVIIYMALSNTALASHPDCSGTGSWATNMAFVYLKNANITNNKKIDFSKTITERLASEEISKNLYNQVHHITFTEKSGKTIRVITTNEASNEECSMSGVTVYVISRNLGEIHKKPSK